VSAAYSRPAGASSAATPAGTSSAPKIRQDPPERAAQRLAQPEWLGESHRPGLGHGLTLRLSPAVVNGPQHHSASGSDGVLAVIRNSALEDGAERSVTVGPL
jgi:hypothetical protein